MNYRSVAGETFTERVVEKSRFLGYCAHVTSEEEAKAFLARLHAMHPAATHICFGYIADKTGNLQRFSDDNEPQGTAGMPILGVIKAQKLFETAVAVVRCFGGIKLGAGGLTRAYATSASEVLAAAEICEYGVCAELRVRAEYSEVNALLKFYEESGVKVLSREFAAQAEFVVAVREEEAEEFEKKLLNCVNGRATVTRGKSYYFPFPIVK
ncbi:MAG: YigZ family protein [Clostridiales bacterium]|nr:YigZ family protein [Clostridiales bacterium]